MYIGPGFHAGSRLIHPGPRHEYVYANGVALANTTWLYIIPRRWSPTRAPAIFSGTFYQWVFTCNSNTMVNCFVVTLFLATRSLQVFTHEAKNLLSCRVINTQRAHLIRWWQLNEIAIGSEFRWKIVSEMVHLTFPQTSRCSVWLHCK